MRGGSHQPSDPNKRIDNNKMGHMGERVAKDVTKTGRLISNPVQVAPSYPTKTGKANPCTFSGSKKFTGKDANEVAKFAKGFFPKP